MGGPARAVVGLLVGVVVLALVGFGVYRLVSRGVDLTPLPEPERCVATAGDRSVALDLEQAHYASIIAGLSVRRGLPPRAASIALATAYQESGIRNLSYGDRDSVGLFQQRPSQGWGTAKQLRDPFYATGKFYDALVKVKGWRTGDINDVAQRVQRSAYPEAYRNHEADARVLASTLTGYSPGGFRCLDRTSTVGRPDGLTRSLQRTYGRMTLETVDATVRVQGRNARAAWAYAGHAVANASYYGVTTVRIGDQVWQAGGRSLPEWSAATPAAKATVVEIILR